MDDDDRVMGQTPLRYESVGYASIEILCGREGVSLVANADGLRSLARLFEYMADRSGEYIHATLDPTLQLTAESTGLDVLRREGGYLPDGSRPPETDGR